MTKKERERLAKIRPVIIKEITALERKYGESVVSGAFSRHQQVRREQARLSRQQAEINAKIAKLRG